MIECSGLVEGGRLVTTQDSTGLKLSHNNAGKFIKKERTVSFLTKNEKYEHSVGQINFNALLNKQKNCFLKLR